MMATTISHALQVGMAAAALAMLATLMVAIGYTVFELWRMHLEDQEDDQ